VDHESIANREQERRLSLYADAAGASAAAHRVKR
jgi:hypothetical protein